MSGRLFIQANNIHQGGGQVLLLAILKSLPIDMVSIVLVDSRISFPDIISSNIKIKLVSPDILSRIRTEIWLSKNVKSGDTILCFGNLPPLFQLKCRVVVFIQNRYLVDYIKLDEFSFSAKLKIIIERIWLTCKISHASEIIVQTHSMKYFCEKVFKKSVPIRVLPFAGKNKKIVLKSKFSGKIQIHKTCFIYVASGEPHKNHKKLIESWCLLSKEGIFPKLELTLNENINSELCDWIKQEANKYKLKVKNLGNLDSEEIQKLYEDADALIYPSVFESFGLPLLEAEMASLPIIASELDYVRDIVSPDIVFNPYSSRSIARAVKRFLDVPEEPLDILSSKDFIKKLLQQT